MSMLRWACALILSCTVGFAFADPDKDESGKGRGKDRQSEHDKDKHERKKEKKEKKEEKRERKEAARGDSYFHRQGHAQLKIPPGHYPPPGECRVWYPDRPPGHQPPPGKCDNVPAGAWLIRHPKDRPGRVHVTAYEPQPARRAPPPPPPRPSREVVVVPAPVPMAPPPPMVIGPPRVLAIGEFDIASGVLLRVIVEN